MMNWQDKAEAATRGTQLGAIIAAALGREIEAPCFHGKASVTSDGFVMCDFTDKSGNGHMGAFVGSMSDLIRNAGGLADHLKLDAAERAEFYEAIKNWISLDYSASAAGLRRAILKTEGTQ
jgi:hypothetical protein